jgi:hypothetical protein
MTAPTMPQQARLLKALHTPTAAREVGRAADGYDDALIKLVRENPELAPVRKLAADVYALRVQVESLSAEVAALNESAAAVQAGQPLPRSGPRLRGLS